MERPTSYFCPIRIDRQSMISRPRKWDVCWASNGGIEIDLWSHVEQLDGTDVPFYVLSQWEAMSGNRLGSDLEARKSLGSLIQKGCVERIVKTCLFRIQVENWEEKYLAKFIGQHRNELARIKKHATKLFELSCEYPFELSQRLKESGDEVDQITVNDHPVGDYNFASLVAYVWSVVRPSKLHAELAALVRCCTMPDNPDGEFSTSAQTKKIKRFIESHPQAWREIEREVETWPRHSPIDLVP